MPPTAASNQAETHLDAAVAAGGEAEEDLSVHISYQIIKLFSEGLYKSPHKAVEELVSNSYDAGAEVVHISTGGGDDEECLWVVDNGSGMDRDGFKRLWTIAKSEKASADDSTGRPPIGQFGIGKLAAYVLARHLTHVSRTPSGFWATTMDFTRVTKKDIEAANPLSLKLHKIDETGARIALTGLKERLPDIFAEMFDEESWPSWTAAAMSDFKPLGKKLKAGTLKWVLRTGLPIASDFAIVVDGSKLKSAVLSKPTIAKFEVGKEDPAAKALKLNTASGGGVVVPGLGPVTGTARIFEKPIDHAKSSEQYHRNHGLFIRVRNRVVNLEDELFGLPAQNHAAWSRFHMEVRADGLRAFLLSSREGVREAEPVDSLQAYFHKMFLECRKKYEQWSQKGLKELDIQTLLENAPTLLVSEPLIDVVGRAIRSDDSPYKYIRGPRDVGDVEEWESAFDREVSDSPFKQVDMVDAGPYGDLVEYDSDTRTVRVNREHPFVSKIAEYSKSDHSSKLIASAEVVGEALLHSLGVEPAVAYEFLDKRDKVLRLLAGEYPAAAPDALRYLEVADENDTALERAVGTAFEVLGFEYEKRGGNRGGADGVLTARLGRDTTGIRTYKLVFDAKTTGKTNVSIDKLRWQALERFREDEGATYGFILGKGFTSQQDEDGNANREARSAGKTLLRITDLSQLVKLHMKYGVTLEELRDLFESAYDVLSVTEWLDTYARKLSSPEYHVPLLDLLQALEDQNDDEGAVPTVHAARYARPLLKRFDADRLMAMLKGVENIVSGRWIEVDEQRGTVRLHQTPAKLVAEVNRVLTLTLPEETDQES